MKPPLPLPAESRLALPLRRRPPRHGKPHPTASLLQVMGAVFWGFLGVRKCKDMAHDVRTIRPGQLIVVGLVFAAIFVLTLILIARLATRGL